MMKVRMKIIAIALIGGLLRLGFADAPVSMNDQLLISLTQHAVGVTEFTADGHTKLAFIDTPIQVGKYQGNYIVGFDGGVVSSEMKPGRLAASWGVHAHVISLVRNYIAPGSVLLNYIEATPRYSYDMDVRHGVFSYTLGAQIPFGGN